MTKSDDVAVMLEIVNGSEEEIGSVELYAALKQKLPDNAPSFRTFMRRLATLVDDGLILRSGKARAVKYLRASDKPEPHTIAEPTLSVPISNESKAIREYVRRPDRDRSPVGYDRDFLEVYVPNDTAYLPDEVIICIKAPTKWFQVMRQASAGPCKAAWLKPTGLRDSRGGSG